jgi:hypothetical protein
MTVESRMKAKEISQMIKDNVSYKSTEHCAFNGHKFNLVEISFNTGDDTKTIFKYDCSCGIRGFRVIDDKEKHHYECSCDTCMPPDTRPPISKYVFITKYKQIGENEPFMVSRNPFDENIIRTKYPEWLREEYSNYGEDE